MQQDADTSKTSTSKATEQSRNRTYSNNATHAGVHRASAFVCCKPSPNMTAVDRVMSTTAMKKTGMRERHLCAVCYGRTLFENRVDVFAMKETL